MTEIYWLTRLESIHTFCEIMLAFIGVFLVIAAISYMSGMDFGGEETIGKIKKGVKISLVLVFFLTMVKLFVPTTNEALMIYGVGGTIDYIKTNPTAKELPDKCMKALDKWMEDMNGETKE